MTSIDGATIEGVVERLFKGKVSIEVDWSPFTVDSEILCGIETGGKIWFSLDWLDLIFLADPSNNLGVYGVDTWLILLILVIG